MGSNIIELAKLGHERAAELKASCGAVDVRSLAQLISDLATQLEVQFVRSTNMAVQLANAESKCMEIQRDKDSLEAVTIAMRDDMRDAREKLEAAEKRIADLQVARDKCFLSGLKTGWEYGIADDTEGYNREISDAQAVIDTAAGIGVKGE
jgi:septation ring formation regulator EzrA